MKSIICKLPNSFPNRSFSAGLFQLDVIRKWLCVSISCLPAREKCGTLLPKDDTALAEMKVIPSNISTDVLSKLMIDMSLNNSVCSRRGIWIISLYPQWPEELQTVEMTIRRKKLGSVAREEFIRSYVNRTVCKTSHLLSSLSSSFNSNGKERLLQNALNLKQESVRKYSKLSIENLIDGMKVSKNESRATFSAKHKQPIKGQTHLRKRKSSEELENVENKTSSEDIGKMEVEDICPKELAKVERRFPQPVVTLNNLCSVVAQELKNSDHSLDKSYRKTPFRSTGKVTQTMWNCTYKVRWPSTATFSATMPTKSAAGKQAALKALHWLQMQGKLTRTGAPLMYEKSEIKDLARIPVEVGIDKSSCEEIDNLVNFYKKDVEPLLMQVHDSEVDKKKLKDNEFNEDSSEELFGTEFASNPITGLLQSNFTERDVEERNIKLYKRYQRRNFTQSNGSPRHEQKVQLPIAEFRSQILEMVRKHPVIVLKGEPGCGKSTQVPQYIMEEWEGRQKGALCNIIVTQPRRISAISISEWVASERQERIGDVVGYQVRLNSAVPHAPGGAILYCSTGILLRRLQSNPGLFGASHIVLDEAHERDINTDVLLVLLRRAVVLNPELRLIVMSATINAELFQKYFNDAPLLNIPGFTYPVKSFFLEDFRIPSLRVKSNLSQLPQVDTNEIAKVINWIDKNRPQGAILCFLPGWAEISSLTKILEKGDSRIVLPVHSRLSNRDQKRIFSVPPPGIRKIILATNIAETSITVNDVVYVVDCGAHKELWLNVDLGVSVLGNQWVSQANVNQRRGRAGRVKLGESYHIYSKEAFDNLHKFPVPELLRVPLEKTVLDCKTYSQDEKAEDFLSLMPEPPAKESIVQAVQELIHLGALDENEKLTPLGRRIALFTTHPKLSKCLVHASIFGCLNPLVTIATLLTSDAEIFQGSLNEKSGIRAAKKKFHPSSDHLALAWLFKKWEKLAAEDEYDALNFCQNHGLNTTNVKLNARLLGLLADHLYHCRMLSDIEEYKNPDALCNRYAGNDEMVKAVLYSGFGTLLYRRNWDVKNGRIIKNTNVILTEACQRVTVTSESVNYRREEFASPYLTYFRQVQSLERRTMMVRETSMVSPLSVLLFSMGEIKIHEYIPHQSSGKQWNDHSIIKISGRQDILMLCSNSQIQKLAELRIILWNIVNYFIMREGVEDDNERYEIVRSFHMQLLRVISKLIYQAGSSIEYDEDGCKRE